MLHQSESIEVIVKIGDITKERVDIIVNAANSSLLGGGGVDGALHRAGGPAILDACREIRRTAYPNGLPAGQVVLTPAGSLHAQYVIHTVGPVYGRSDAEEKELLAACYWNALELAREKGALSIAFPSISTGAYGFPRELAARVVAQTLKKYMLEYDMPRLIELVFFTAKEEQAFLENCEW
ncbi:MAG: O-acetyl-ADP-ribose deacetylase [Spirochaetae bacterium HGW-Spirochaetae-6]|nr:MAG: O-acetyl-ADP-ribose deacetylase [Spirochaetae bacterium HGW-Spirochaetae-6]